MTQFFLSLMIFLNPEKFKTSNQKPAEIRPWYPKSKKEFQTSHCYRTSYRGLLKGLAFKDVEHIDAAIREALKETGAQLR